MKFRDILNWIKKAGKPEEQVRQIDIEDPYATIQHKTKERYIGMRRMPRHNNRKRTKGRNIQYIRVGKSSKPIYHSAN